MRFLTLIGQPALIYTIATLAMIAAWQAGRPHLATAFGLTFVAQLGNTVLKTLFQRDRPDTLYVDAMIIKSYSFPSGHAFGAAVFYGLLAYLAYAHLVRPWNIFLAILIVFVAIGIGVSRIFLGAHFPSDVGVGWVLGLLSLLIIIKVTQV